MHVCWNGFSPANCCRTFVKHLICMWRQYNQRVYSLVRLCQGTRHPSSHKVSVSSDGNSIAYNSRILLSLFSGCASVECHLTWSSSQALCVVKFWRLQPAAVYAATWLRLTVAHMTHPASLLRSLCRNIFTEPHVKKKNNNASVPVRRKLSVIWIVCNMTDKKRQGWERCWQSTQQSLSVLYFTHVMLCFILTFISSFLLLGWKGEWSPVDLMSWERLIKKTKLI